MALQIVSTDSGSCLFGGDVCSTRASLGLLMKFYKSEAAGGENTGGENTGGENNGGENNAQKKEPKTVEDLLNCVQELLGVDSELKVLEHSKFQDFLGDAEKERIAKEIDTRFKTSGPRENTTLLNNHNIDKTLHQWATKYPEFYGYSFCMMDFDEGGEFRSIEDQPMDSVLCGKAPQTIAGESEDVFRMCKCAGVVLNTDVSTGKGKHWVAAFVDCRDKHDWSVEYFNSSGNPPPPPVARWLVRTHQRLEAFLSSLRDPACAPNVTSVTSVTSEVRKFWDGHENAKVSFSGAVSSKRHQQSRTECGLYSLFYIRARLDGTSFKFFDRAFINDDEMTEFRKHVFRND